MIAEPMTLATPASDDRSAVAAAGAVPGDGRGWPICQTLLLGAVVASLVLAGMQPFLGRLSIIPYKYVPLAIALVAWMFHLCTSRSAPGELIAIVRYYWQVTVLVAVMFGGFLYAEYARGYEVTFRPHALSLLSFFICCHLGMIAEPARFARSYLVMLSLMALFMFGVAWAFFPQQLIHENVYLFVPTAVFCGLVARSRGVRWAAFGFMALFAVVGLKNTTFILTAVSIYLLAVFNRREVREGTRPPFRLESLVAIGLVAVLGYVALDYIKSINEAFSSGNADFRNYLYGETWAKFLASPVWGDCFSDTPNVQFRLFTVGGQNAQFLPSHSDLLDVLAHGGVIGMALFLAFLWRVLRDALHGGSEPEVGTVDYAARACLLAIAVAALVSATFNPVLGNPANGFMFWATFGVLAGMRQHRLAAERAAARNERMSHA
ncbi:MAG: O-antigen ligase family protein [Planctomycetes bacterium]|nr:O-antigen ligase family protein [Planctomycetota bacterium]